MSTVCALVVGLAVVAPAAAPKPGSAELPLVYLGPGLANSNAPDGGIMYTPGVQNIQIYRANRKPSAFFGGQPGYTYQHHIDIGCWKDRLYAVWDMSPKDEDTLPCRLVYSTSDDGFNWSEPKDLYPPGMGWNMRFYFYHAFNGRMLVFAAGPTDKEKMKEIEKTTLLVREITPDHRLGDIYTLINPGPKYPPSFEQCQDAGFVAACREACNNKPLLEQQDYGVLLGERKMKWHDGTNWPSGKVSGGTSFWIFGKALCFYHRQDGTLVGLCKLGYTTLSTDAGQTWSFPVIPKGIVAGGGKVWGQRTPDGRYAMIYPPQSPGPRFPMAVTTSDDGITFRDMRVIHGEVPPQRYEGHCKDMGPQYLRGVAEWGGDAPTIDKSAIWVIYSVNKDDIWVSRIPVPILAKTKEPVRDTFDNVPTGARVPGWNVYSPSWASVHIAKATDSANHFLELTDSEPVDYARAIRTFPVSSAGEISFRLAANQNDHGRLEIDLLSERNARPVRIVLNEQGRLLVANGQSLVAVGDYSAGKWAKFTLKFGGGKFSLLRDGKLILKGAAFAEAASKVYAISFRTGEFRGTVPEMAKVDLLNTEEMAAASGYRIDDVMTSHLRHE